MTSPGNVVVFESEATNLADGDTNGAQDIFAAANPLFVPSYQPDNRIGRGAAISSSVGNGVYNANGAGQELRLNSRKARTVRAYLHAENDGTGDDSLLVRGSRGNRYFNFLYASGGNQTGAIVAGTYTTPSLTPGESQLVSVTVKPKRSKLRKVKRRRGRKKVRWLSKTYRALLTSTSTMDGNMADSAAIRVKHR